MTRHRKLTVIVLLSIALLLSTSVAASAHSWSANCSNGVGYFIGWENAGSPSGSGDSENACNSDNDWGNAFGEVQGFHDTMSAYHLRDRAGDDYRFCAVFFKDAFYGGGALIVGALTNDQHFVETNLSGSGFNDSIDSHIQYGENGDVCG